MLTVNMHEAKSKLSELVAAVESGRETEVVFARNGKPAVKLVALTRSDSSARIGIAKGQFTMPGDEEWAAMDKEIERMFLGEDGDQATAAP